MKQKTNKRESSNWKRLIKPTHLCSSKHREAAINIVRNKRRDITRDTVNEFGNRRN